MGDVIIACVRSIEREGSRGSGRRREVWRAAAAQHPELQGLPVKLVELGGAGESKPRRGAQVLSLSDVTAQQKTVSRRQFDCFSYVASLPRDYPCAFSYFYLLATHSSFPLSLRYLLVATPPGTSRRRPRRRQARH